MSHASPLVLALDFGGTKISAAAVVPGGRAWTGLAREQSPQGANATSDFQTALDLAAKVLSGGHPAAVGVSFGGPVRAESGIVKLSHHVPGWEDVPLAGKLQGELGGAPVRVENDGIAGALGEYRYGAGQGVDSLLYLTVSTGVGGGIIVNGKIWHGADGMAGHVGHLRLEPDGPDCVCGSRGCLESIAAGPALVREARARIAREPERAGPLLALVDGDASKLTARHIGDTARTGDPFALALIERAGTALGIGIGSAANLLNPDRVLVGGGVSKAGDPLWRPLLALARETAMPEVSLDVRPAGLGDDAPLWGAVALAHDLLEPGVAQAAGKASG